MARKLSAVVGDSGFGRTGGEQYNARLLAIAREEGIEVSYITWSDSAFDKLMASALLWRLRNLFRALWLTWRLWRSSGDLFVDVWMAPYAMFWAKLSRRQSVTLMVHHLRGHLEQGSWRRAWVSYGERELVNRAARILTVSQSSKRQIQKLCRHAVQVDIIPPGFDRAVLREDQTQRHGKDVVELLFVGHLTRAKGVVDLVHAVARLADDLPWKLSIAGSGSAEPETAEELNRLIKQFGLEKRIELCGHVSNKRLASLYQQADIFVLPSYWEGYGIVLLEAMAMGLPIISTTAGAIPEVVADGKAGILVPCGDVAALQSAIADLILSPEQREAMAKEAYAQAAQASDWTLTEQRFHNWWSDWKGRS